MIDLNYVSCDNKSSFMVFTVFERKAGNKTKAALQAAHDEEAQMISRLMMILSFAVLFAVVAGVAVLAAWDFPVEQKQVEITLDVEKLLTKAP